MDYFLNLFYVYMMGCAFLTLCFGIEGAMAVAYWLRDRWRWMRWFSL